MLLSELRALAIDCQAARGQLIEIGWASGVEAESRRVRLPEGVSLSERARRVTGLTDEDLATGISEEEAWQLLDEAARGTDITLIHFARFEEPFLKWLHHRFGGDTRYPFRVLCTHDLVARLVPELPRRSLRAAAGYFGCALDEKRRAADHAAATLIVWQACLRRLEDEHGVRDLSELELFLNANAQRAAAAAAAAARSFPMPPALIAGLPSEPGVYRMRRNEDAGERGVLYVGKAASLRQRVRSYFAPGARHAPHTLEMLAQARGLDVTVTGTPMEAALLEVAEIHRLDPPYNRALRARERSIVFASRDLAELQEVPDRRHRVGPLPAGFIWTAWPEASEGLDAPLAHGTRLWQADPAREEPGELTLGTDESERRDDVLVRVAHLVRRAHWLRLIRGARLEWPGGTLELATPGTDGDGDAWTVAEYDRHVVFTSELRRLVASGTEVTLRTKRAALPSGTVERLLRYV